MEESVLTGMFGESPRMKILDYLLEFPTNEFTPSDLVEAIGMSRTTVFREIKNLEEQKMIRLESKLGKSTAFRINLKNPIIKMIQQTVFLKSDNIAEQQRANRKIQTIIRKSLTNRATIESWQKALKEELTYTNKKLKTIHAT